MWQWSPSGGYFLGYSLEIEDSFTAAKMELPESVSVSDTDEYVTSGPAALLDSVNVVTVVALISTDIDLVVGSPSLEKILGGKGKFAVETQ